MKIFGAAGESSIGVDCEDERNAPADRARPRAAGADLQDLEHAAIRQRGSGLSGFGERRFEQRKIVAVLQAAGL